jgi:xanthine/uracil/vitamin C permease (AzgA family)
VARTAQLIAATMLCSGVVALTGFAIGVAAVVWTGLIAGCLAWLCIPLWVLALGRALVPSRAVLPSPETAASHQKEARP